MANSKTKLTAEELNEGRKVVLDLIRQNDNSDWEIEEINKKEVLPAVPVAPKALVEIAVAPIKQKEQSIVEDAVKPKEVKPLSEKETRAVLKELELDKKQPVTKKKVNKKDIESLRSKLDEIKKERIEKREQYKKLAKEEIDREKGDTRLFIEDNNKRINELRKKLKDDDKKIRERLKLSIKETMTSDIVMFTLLLAAFFLTGLIVYLKNFYETFVF